MVKDHAPANSEPPTHVSRRSRDRQGAVWPLRCDATLRYRGAEVALATQKIASHPDDYKIEYRIGKTVSRARQARRLGWPRAIARRRKNWPPSTSAICRRTG